MRILYSRGSMRISHSGEQPISLRGSTNGSIWGGSKKEQLDFLGFYGMAKNTTQRILPSTWVGRGPGEFPPWENFHTILYFSFGLSPNQLENAFHTQSWYPRLFSTGRWEDHWGQKSKRQEEDLRRNSPPMVIGDKSEKRIEMGKIPILFDFVSNIHSDIFCKKSVQKQKN